MTSSKPSSSGRKRSATPFFDVDVGHTVVKALEEFDYTLPDSATLLKQLQHIEYGLSAEVEFAAIASWLGRCSLAHRLDQDQFSSPGVDAEWRIPDLLLILEHQGETVPLLVEVKTTAKETLAFTPEYLKGLRQYADAVGLPLLIAWRPRRLGKWCLFDPELARPAGRKLVLDLDTLKNDLMGWVLGDFMIVPKAGARFSIRFELQRLPTPAKDAETIEAKLAEVYWQDAAGHRTDAPPDGVLVTVLSRSELVSEREGSRLIQSWISGEDGTCAQGILRATVAFAISEEERIHWRPVAKDLENILSRNQLLKDLNANLGTFVQYVLFQEPHMLPTFVPDSWNKKEP